MPLRNALAYGASVDRDPVIPLEVSVNTLDFDVFDEAVLVGGSFSPADNVEDGIVIITIQNNVRMGASLITTYGLQSGVGWGTGWEIHIIVKGSNTGRIQAAGGRGGRMAQRQFVGFDPPFLTFTIIDGAGGGGAGSNGGLGGDLTPATGPPDYPSAGKAFNGTPNAGGATFASSGIRVLQPPAPELAAEAGFVGGNALFANTAGPDIRFKPEALATLEVFGGGGGGGGGDFSLGSPNGGSGGGPGLDGITSVAGLIGGANGIALEIEGAASVFQDGPGTIDVRGV